MTHETTHRRDPNTGHMRQLVSPYRLREILDEDGETYDPPSGFGPHDEWHVADTDWEPRSEFERRVLGDLNE